MNSMNLSSEVMVAGSWVVRRNWFAAYGGSKPLNSHAGRLVLPGDAPHREAPCEEDAAEGAVRKTHRYREQLVDAQIGMHRQHDVRAEFDNNRPRNNTSGTQLPG